MEPHIHVPDAPTPLTVSATSAPRTTGTPSYAEWTWTVVRAPGGCEVTVTWTVETAVTRE
jgi:hypothetical protein